MCVCVWVGCQWSIFCCWKMAVIYMKRSGSACGLFLVNHFASDCATLLCVLIELG